MFKGRITALLLLVFLVLVLAACPRVNNNPEWFLPIGDRSVEETKPLEIVLTDHVTDDTLTSPFTISVSGSLIRDTFPDRLH